jgi:hypothetical protein
MNNKILLSVLLSAISVFAGCGGPFPVKMTFTLDGKPLGDATVALAPDTNDPTESPHPAEGKTLADGTVTFKSSIEDGVYAGKYIVTVKKTEEDWGKKGKPSEERIASLKAMGISIQPQIKNIVPDKYATSSRSDLKVSIGYFSEKTFSFDLTSSQMSKKSAK